MQRKAIHGFSRLFGKLQRSRSQLHCGRVLTCDYSDEGYDESKKRPAAGSYRSPVKVMKDELRDSFSDHIVSLNPHVPREIDILIIGGGLVGSSVAYWLKQRNPKGFTVAVVERDPYYTQASSMLSVGGLRHQFTLPENVEMSMFTTDFLRNIREHLSVLNHDPPDVQFNHHGYMFLVPEERAEVLANSIKMQRELGAKIDLLSKAQLSRKFPWLNLDGVECGSYGREGEGWFDPWMLLKALKIKNQSYGVQYIHGSLEKFNFRTEQMRTEKGEVPIQVLDHADIRHADEHLYGCKFAMVINCAGAWAGEVAKLAGIGVGQEELSVALPVEPRKRFVYVVHCKDGPGLETPMTVDTSGAYFRREGMGGMYLCGSSPLSDEGEPDISNLDVDYDFYQDHVWPSIANRVPKFENSKLKNAWAGYYDYNTFDQNLVIGNHPHHRQFFFANGMSGHGVQQAVSIGRAMMELILDDGYKTIDLSRFSFDRFIREEPVKEMAIV